MNYQQAYDYLNSLSNLRRKEYMTDPRHCSLYLKRLQFFLNILGNPEKKISHYIHVTGTSGKGSLCLMLQSILKEDKKNVGTLISPHPTHITERWQIGGKSMKKSDFTKIIETFKTKLDQYIQTSPYDMVSFHEITTAIGLYYFAQKKVDWAITEVGCGGRYDSTNIIPKKDIAIITNIGLDHTGIFGNSKKNIAYEKAGIIKSGCKIFTMEKNKKILSIIENECKKTKTHLIQVKAKILQKNITLEGTSFTYKNESYKLKTIGKHQIQNATLAIEIAKEINIPTKSIKKGLSKVTLPIRMEVTSKSPITILDSAHNTDKIKSTVNTINSLSLKPYTLHLIIGFSENKKINTMLKELKKLNPKSIAITRNTINPFRKVLDPKELEQKCKKIFPKAEIQIFLDPIGALDWSKKKLKKHDILLITGSIFLSGELRPFLTK